MLRTAWTGRQRAKIEQCSTVYCMDMFRSIAVDWCDSSTQHPAWMLRLRRWILWPRDPCCIQWQLQVHPQCGFISQPSISDFSSIKVWKTWYHTEWEMPMETAPPSFPFPDGNLINKPLYTYIVNTLKINYYRKQKYAIQESLANAEMSTRQQCVYEVP